jgi:DNA-binding beta-propeller fold protein YncE
MGRRPLGALLLACGSFSGLAACNKTPPEPAHFAFAVPSTNELIQVDLRSHQQLSPLVVGGAPAELARRADGPLYVSLSGSGAIVVIDLEKNGLLRTIPTAPLPPIAAHLEKKAERFTSCYACHFEGPRGAKPATVGGRPVGLVPSSDGRTLIVANTALGALAVLDLGSNEAPARPLPLAARGAVRSPGAMLERGGALYLVLSSSAATSTQSAVLRRLDATTLTANGEAELGSVHAGGLAFDAQRRQLLVSGVEAGTVSRFEADLRPIDRIPVGAAPAGLVASPDGRRLWVACAGDGRIVALDLERGTKVRDIALEPPARPTRLWLSSTGRTLYALVGGAKPRILELDPESLAEKSALPLDAEASDGVLLSP